MLASGERRLGRAPDQTRLDPTAEQPPRQEEGMNKVNKAVRIGILAFAAASIGFAFQAIGAG